MEAGSRPPGRQPAAKTPLTHDSLTLPGTGLQSRSRKLFPFAQLGEAPDLVFSPPQLLPALAETDPLTQPAALGSKSWGLIPHHLISCTALLCRNLARLLHKSLSGLSCPPLGSLACSASFSHLTSWAAGQSTGKKSHGGNPEEWDLRGV